MAGYQLEKIEIGFNLSFYFLKNFVQMHLPRQGYTGIKKT